MHVSFLIHSLRGGGAERGFVNLSNKFVQSGLKVDLVLMQKRGPNLKNISTKVETFSLEATRYLNAILPMVRYLKKEKPDFLISAQMHCNILSILAGRLAGIPLKTILTEHSLFHFYIQKFKKPKRNFSKFLAYFFYKKADCIVAVSQVVKDSLVKGLKITPNRIKVIYNPVFDNSIINSSKEEISHPFFLNQINQIVLGAGSLIKVKDFPTLIKAFRIAREKKNLKLIILGEGKNKIELEQLITDLKLESDISLPGYAENPYAYMSKTDVFVVSSLSEGLPNVLIEAMACGTPVVSTESGGPSEILENGKYGILVPVGDVQKLSEAIIKTLESPIDKNILKERAKHFSVDNAVEKYLSLINELKKKYPNNRHSD